jgi:hypothetical protein
LSRGDYQRSVAGAKRCLSVTHQGEDLGLSAVDEVLALLLPEELELLEAAARHGAGLRYTCASPKPEEG